MIVTLSDTESHSIPLPCISSSDFSLLLSPIQPGSIRRHHQVRNNPLDRLLTHAFPCSKVSLLHLALAVTRLQVATPFPPRARTNYVGVVARSPHIACVVHRALGRTVSRATCCPHHMLHCLSGALLVSHPLPVLLVAPPPVAQDRKSVV